MLAIHTKRLTAADRELARPAFATIAAVFEEDYVPLSDTYLDRLLAREDFWAIVAIADNDDVGALDFYRALGGCESGVTSFDFTHTQTDRSDC